MAIPCYNEEEVLHETAKRLEEKYYELKKNGKISDESRVVFIDDGSRDRTWEIIEEFHEQNEMFSGIKLSRNRGHQNALLCGLMTVRELADAVISMYADFRLMSKRALEGFSEFKEVNLFLRGIVPMVGYKSDIVTYERAERFAGESKYPLKKMLAFAFEGITSLSTKPIKLITGIGFIIFAVSIIMVIYNIIRFFMGATVPGWASLAVSIWALGGIQLISIGLIGEYIGKIYLESKHRPRYIVEKFINK